MNYPEREPRMPTVARTGALLLLSALPLAALACDDDPADPGPATSDFTVRIENVGTAYDFVKSGTFDTGVNAGSPGAIGPGDAFEFEFTAPLGSKLTFATMFVPSNDFFYAPGGAGLDLYDETGAALSGDVTSQVMLWDAGTEVNQEPGAGPDQVQRQSGPDTGDDDPDDTVRLAPDDFANLPNVEDVIEVTVTPGAASAFTVRIENVSTATTLATSEPSFQPVPLSPGAWLVHQGDDPLFTVGSPDRDEGLEGIAEDGDPAALGSSTAPRTGITVPLSPGAWAVHTTADPLFTDGSADRGDGLEAVAEDGSPAALAATLNGQTGVSSAGAFDTPVAGGGPAAIGPGGAFEFTISAQEGDALSLATMFVASNDLFYAPDGNGIDLFPGGVALTGAVTPSLALWDAGTEINEEPGVGPNQVQRQTGPDTGPDEGGNVVLLSSVGDGFTYPEVASVIQVTVTPSGS